jgi:bifunctional oligoribonuclease and PAP phosphatase NrnA
VDGVQVAALIREQVPLADGSITSNRVSLRSRGSIDVSQIARKSSGGGHKQAAGFSHPGSIDQIRQFIVDEVASQLAESAA